MGFRCDDVDVESSRMVFLQGRCLENLDAKGTRKETTTPAQICDCLDAKEKSDPKHIFPNGG